MTGTDQDPSAQRAAGGRRELLGLSRQGLTSALADLLDRPYRARQIYDAIYRQGAVDFAAMTSLSVELRRRLEEHCQIGLPQVVDRHRSADGTTKYLFRLADTATIETVDIPDGPRHTLCLSSQAGCALACAFCVTAYWGGGRNLTAGEIVGQVLAAGREIPGRAAGLNLVFMGMGEPLLNLGPLTAALGILAESVSWRRITVSTVGIIPGIEELARWPRRPNLAISLHAPDAARRGLLMPVERSYPLTELLACLRRYPLEKGRKLTFEYLLIADLNDQPADAEALVRLLAGLRAKVNLIPVNSDPVLGPKMVPPPPDRIEAFRQRLVARGLFATVRRRRGDDVSAACGQLRAPHRPPRGWRQGSLSW